uniref:Uncharacterized protein n=1 Tax=Myotis myotis TaxID=51298 RepID=A0A7J7VIN9_MYOMY|nr:hypothetical protein mMyoMyo1_008324 [Myotis myotis]
MQPPVFLTQRGFGQSESDSSSSLGEFQSPDSSQVQGECLFLLTLRALLFAFLPVPFVAEQQPGLFQGSTLEGDINPSSSSLGSPRGPARASPSKSRKAAALLQWYGLKQGFTGCGRQRSAHWLLPAAARAHKLCPAGARQQLLQLL